MRVSERVEYSPKTHIKRYGYGGKITVCQKFVFIWYRRVVCVCDTTWVLCCDFQNQHLRRSSDGKDKAKRGRTGKLRMVEKQFSCVKQSRQTDRQGISVSPSDSFDISSPYLTEKILRHIWICVIFVCVSCKCLFANFLFLGNMHITLRISMKSLNNYLTATKLFSSAHSFHFQCVLDNSCTHPGLNGCDHTMILQWTYLLST